MKTRLLGLFLVLFVVVISCTGCTSKISDTGTTSDIKFKGYDFWEKPNQLRIIITPSIDSIQSDGTEGMTVGTKTLPANKASIVKELQKGIIAFFKERYNVDVTEKISRQEIRVFSPDLTNYMTGIAFGYVDPSYPDILNLNELLFIDDSYKDLFENTYVHETLHQIGIRNPGEPMLTEGITDAYTDMILCYIGHEKVSVTTPFYFEARTLAYQIIAVDNELPHLYFETKSFSLSKRISERLSNVEQVYEIYNDTGALLNKYLTVLNANATGRLLGHGNDIVFYAHGAQEIVRSYCQTFAPNKQEIDYIRSHYLIIDYEDMSFIKTGDGRYKLN